MRYRHSDFVAAGVSQVRMVTAAWEQTFNSGPWSGNQEKSDPTVISVNACQSQHITISNDGLLYVAAIIVSADAGS
jgi:hypothetical protein